MTRIKIPATSTAHAMEARASEPGIASSYLATTGTKMGANTRGKARARRCPVTQQQFDDLRPILDAETYGHLLGTTPGTMQQDAPDQREVFTAQSMRRGTDAAPDLRRLQQDQHPVWKPAGLATAGRSLAMTPEQRPHFSNHLQCWLQPTGRLVQIALLQERLRHLQTLSRGRQMLRSQLEIRMAQRGGMNAQFPGQLEATEARPHFGEGSAEPLGSRRQPQGDGQRLSGWPALTAWVHAVSSSLHQHRQAPQVPLVSISGTCGRCHQKR